MANKPVWGNDCVFSVDANGSMVPLICAKSFRVNTTNELIETTSHTTGYWKSFAYQSVSYTLSFDGAIVFTDEVKNRAFDVLLSQISFVEINFVLGFIYDGTNRKFLKGTVLVSSSDLAAAVNEHASFNIEFQGTGEYIVSDTGCFASIASVSHAVGIGGFNFTLTGISSDTTLLQYSIDGAAREDIAGYDQGDGSIVVLIDVDSGTHTLYFYPLCSEDEEGTGVIDTVHVL